MRDEGVAAVAAGRPTVIAVGRRGPVLRRSPTAEGVYGLDLTAGCLHGCAYCHIRGARSYPGEDRVYFDPRSAELLPAALERLGEGVRRVVLSPSSDPLPPDRAVRAEAVRVVQVLLRQGIDVFLMTRGRVPRGLIRALSAHPGRATVAVGMLSLNRVLVRALEPRAASPRGRLRDLGRLVEAGVDVEARIEPILPGLTDTRENLLPMLRDLARAGVRRVVAHHLFLLPAMAASLSDALAPLGWSERGRDDFEGGPVHPIGSIGSAKLYPRDLRREGLARLVAWGAECGLTVTTGSSQNPDLPRPPDARRPEPRRAPELVAAGP